MQPTRWRFGERGQAAADYVGGVVVVAAVLAAVGASGIGGQVSGAIGDAVARIGGGEPRPPAGVGEGERGADPSEMPMRLPPPPDVPDLGPPEIPMQFPPQPWDPRDLPSDAPEDRETRAYDARVVIDPSLEGGAVWVETPQGRFDVGRQLGRIAQDPLRLVDEFGNTVYSPGDPVTVTGSPAENTMTFCQCGPFLEVEDHSPR